MSDSTIFYTEDSDPAMNECFLKAQKTFKYFWREQSWEYRRIVPALDLAYVKVIFTEKLKRGINTEHMWIGDIQFDGDFIHGTLLNNPEHITTVKNGDAIKTPINELSDWMFATNNIVYGGFTIQLIRSRMSPAERKAHDEAWGLNFGNPEEVLLVSDQMKNPINMIEHPMSINMKDKFATFLKDNPNEVTSMDENGLTLLHKETIAGNKTIVELLLEAGADKSTKSASGKTALDYANEMDWKHLIAFFG